MRYYSTIISLFTVLLFTIFASPVGAALQPRPCQGLLNLSAPYNLVPPAPTNDQFFCGDVMSIDEAKGIVYICEEVQDAQNTKKCIRHDNPLDIYTCSDLGNNITRTIAGVETPFAGWLFTGCGPELGIDTQAPTPPTPVTVTPVSASQVDITWGASTDNVGVVRYEVSVFDSYVTECFFCTDPASMVFIVSPEQLSYSVTNLLPNKLYGFIVIAYDASGLFNIDGMHWATTPTDTNSPSAPTFLTAVASPSVAQVSLSWTASTDEVGGSGLSGYRIFRNNILIQNDVSLSATTYLDTSVIPATDYTYHIIAYDNAGNNSLKSNDASVTTFTPLDTTPPSPVPVLSGNIISATQINLTWTASADEVGGSGLKQYDISRDGIILASVSEVTLSYSDTSISALQAYAYMVTAVDGRDIAKGGGNRTNSNALTFSTPPLPDTTAPVFTFTRPSLATPLPESTISTTLEGSTDESSTCKYSKNANQDFNTQMTAFATTGNVSHITTILGLDAGINTYYVKCRDSSPALNISTDFSISFTVTTPVPQPPIFTFTSPNAITPSPAGTVSVVLSGTTNNVAYCKYHNQDVTYFNASMLNFLSDPSGKIHSATIPVIDDTSYTYYVRCQNNPGGETNASSYTISFSVSAPENIAPVALMVVNQISGIAPFTVSVNGSSSFDPDNQIAINRGIATYTWKWGFLGNVNALGISASHTYTATGEYFITLIVEDDKGVKSQANQKITVIAPPDVGAPQISNGSPSGILPFEKKSAILSVQTNEDASCKYNEDIDVDFSVMLGTLTSVDSRLHSVVIPSLTTGSSYIYYVRCQDKASPPNVNTEGYEISFSVAGSSNTLPNVNITSASPTTGNPSLIVSVEGTARDPDGIIAQYIWDWGDGSQTLGITNAPSATNLTVSGATHTYTTPGTYSIMLIAVDNQNQSGVSHVQEITVLPLPVVSTPSICSAACNTNDDCGPNICGLSGICIAPGSVGPGPLRFDGSVSLSDGSNAQLTPASFSAGIRAISMYIKTDIPATCRYSSVSGSIYQDTSMRQFSTGDFITHSVQLGGLQSGTHEYEVRCQDTETGEVNTSNYSISFSIGLADLILGPDPHICVINTTLVKNNLPHLFDVCRLETDDTDPPTFPTGLALTVNPSSQVNLSWTASGDGVGSGVVGYRIYRKSGFSACPVSTTYNTVLKTCEIIEPCATPGGCQRDVSDCPLGMVLDDMQGFCVDPVAIQIGLVRVAIIFTDKSVTRGVTYTYYVRAFDRAGNLSLRPADSSDEEMIIIPN